MGKIFKILVLLAVICKVAFSFSDVGKWDLPMSGEDCSFAISKSLFKDTKLSIVLHCDTSIETNLTVSFKLRPTWCSPDYYHYFEKQIVDCTNQVDWSTTFDINNSSNIPELVLRKMLTCTGTTTVKVNLDKDPKDTKDVKEMGKEPNESPSRPFGIPEAGTYALLMKVQSNTPFNATFHIELLAPSGYLSASLWPLLPFFGTMCGVYAVLCAGWLAVCALQWRDLLRIQYWIGGVALLGMVESALYYGVYSSINTTGLFNFQAYMCAEWVSVAKRALARMLVIIVSLGFGIVKPRLGPALQRVVGTGALWATFGGIEAWLRLHRARSPPRALLLAEAPLSLLDSAICWWVFVSLAHTMRTLQLRRNSVKLSLYRHFTNTLIFAVIASVIFMLYSLKCYRILDCITDWKGVWMDEAYWHMLFAGVLAAIMVLWRPTNNNQRYAFTPLLDNAEDDDEEEEQFVNDAYGVKMRGTSAGAGAGTGEPDARKESRNSLDSDLRWVEENIPSSTLPLLDSDEEIINTKFEVSKMQ